MARGQFDGILEYHIPDASAFYPDYRFLPAVARHKWLERRKWKPITARVLHIEAIDKKDSDGVLEPRKYKLDLVFQWQGIDWYRSWILPRMDTNG